MSVMNEQQLYQIFAESEERYKNVILDEACKDTNTARKFVSEVQKLGKKYDANYFIVTDGASGTHNAPPTNEAVRHARECHKDWEKENGFDPDHDWSKEKSINEAKFFKKVNGKKYVDVSSDYAKNVTLDMKDTIEVNGKKYAYQLSDYVKDNKAKLVGNAVGSAVGMVTGPIGSMVSSAVGSTIGSKIDKMRQKRNAKKVLPTAEGCDYRSPEFVKVMNEYFDNTDAVTRKTLLSINEQDQNKVIVSLTSKLYNSVINKIDDIDFGEIPNTRGDISKLSNWNQMNEVIHVMKEILMEYKQDTADTIGVLEEAINNMVSTREIWMAGYQKNLEFPMAVYNTVVLDIIAATTYLISNTVEYIKIPSSDSFTVTVNKNALVKTRDHLVFENLKKINTSFHNGQMQKSMNYILKETNPNKSNLVGGLAIGAGVAIAGVVGILFVIIPCVRELIFMFYHTRVRVSEYFEMQADFLKLNAYNVEANRTDLTKEQKRSISTKQIKVAKKFDKFADKISVEMKQNEKKAATDIKAEENKKYKIDDVVDTKPDSSDDDSSGNSSLF